MKVLCLGGAGGICREAALEILEDADVFSEIEKREISIHEKLIALG